MLLLSSSNILANNYQPLNEALAIKGITSTMCNSIDDSKVSSHELNKREMFDGMRAYHESELSHKRDCINLYRSIFTGTIAAYAAVLGSIFSETLKLDNVELLAVSIFLIISSVTVILAIATNKKLAKDHSGYQRYLSEYSKECEYLGLRSTFITVENKSEAIKKIPLNPIAGPGYKYTQLIIDLAMVAVVSVSGMLAYLVIEMANK